MMNESCPHPDLLRRFVATPYVFTKGDGLNRICVESNDLEIAWSVRHSYIARTQRSKAGGLYCKLIRDRTAPADGSEVSVVSDGNLRVLHRGSGTILIHDLEKSELLGFICPNVTAQELISSLIPALLDLKS
ncbi:MAG TPA: hypothetical protein VHW70_13375 [Edaphobacter sp.]|jgi:hypothetical protein|nr:hypothetical protein [Edaphobacter sp.]